MTSVSSVDSEAKLALVEFLLTSMDIQESARRCVDWLVAHAPVGQAVVLVVEALLCLSVFGPQPLGWLWIGSQVDYLAGSHMLGIATAFFGILASLFLTLAACTRLDRVWRLLRRAAGHEQRDGVLPRIFGASAVVALVVFVVWFLIIEGPAPSLAPR
jgi:amino acid transporter